MLRQVLFFKMKIHEVVGNLFESNEKFALAHCVSADFAMNAGIAKTFKTKFGKVDGLHHLYNRQTKVGEICCKNICNRWIFHLVTKKLYFKKPTYKDLNNCLQEMKTMMMSNDLKFLAIPLLGCGLDRLSWSKVKSMIINVFFDTDIEIKVYKLSF